LRIEGLRDPLAAAPIEVLERHGLTAPELFFEPFLSLDPQLVELRARQQLRPPADVTLQALQAEQAKREALAAAARALEHTDLHFISGSAELTPDTNIENVRARWHQLLTAADAAGLPICVAIVGHADPIGSPRTNQMLSEARAAHAARTLTVATDDARIRIVGAGVLHDAESLEQARSVTFEVDVGTGCPGRDGTSDDD
jgi:OOP family OmpA-OmpF porin